ncbi:hypothetical protein HYG81_07355 [Natrinema zhouii]|uniref:Uncharacterized protein n=1 Tax=Natrinema zhouii TaxID=1710539 RepID=A0A7D6CM26_9EURY|nr:hypothetical protein [Natrinema zhouii]QLK24318.1 hypothetical protein HYG81_07355 [Natrinema zhouii]
MNRLVESDECERCGDRIGAFRRLCPDCTRIVRDAWEGPLRVPERDDLTLEQRREIAEMLSTRAVTFEVESDIIVSTD